MAQQGTTEMYHLVKDAEMRRRVLWQQIKGDLLAWREMWPQTGKFEDEYADFQAVCDVIDAAIVSIDEAME